MENEKENNKQILSNALKALRECEENSLSEEHRKALYNASADDLYKAYLDIDTYFNADKCFSIENPCCAYGLCAGGILTTATLCGTVLPCIYNSIPSPPSFSNMPLGGTYCRSYGIGQALAMATLATLGPAIGGVSVLNKHEARAKEKIKKISEIFQYIRDDKDVYFFSTLKDIISFHSYDDTERNRIKKIINELCKKRQTYIDDAEKLEKQRQEILKKIEEKKIKEYNKKLKETNNSGARINNKQENDKNYHI